MYDIIVIGGGPGGYVAAIRAAQLGMKVALVEREHLGGICLNWGCIPTKSLLRSSDVLGAAQRGAHYGLRVDANGTQDIVAVVKRSRRIAARLNQGVAYLLKKNRVQVVSGEGVIRDGAVHVQAAARASRAPPLPLPKDSLGAGTYPARHIIIATGARPKTVPPLESDGRLVWTYYEAMIPERIPSSLIIVGSGAIGIEFASFYRAMGSNVTVIEVQDRVMPLEDAEIANHVRARLERRGIKILTSASVTSLARGEDNVTVELNRNGEVQPALTADRLISAVGATANVEGLGLDALGVAVKNGFVLVDDLGRTNIDGIYAIGDVAGVPMLAHKAEHQGVACVEAIAGRPAHGVDRALIPACTYGDPQVASIGLTQEAAERAGISLKIGRFPFVANGKAIALGESEGMIKTLFDAKTGKLVGAHMVGAEVTELIQGYAIAMTCGATMADLHRTVFPHPTISEIMHEASLDADGRAIHV